MANSPATGNESCRTTCWIVAVAIGLLFAALVMAWLDFRILTALIWGAVAFAATGMLMPRLFCIGDTSSASPAVSAPTPKAETKAETPPAPAQKPAPAEPAPAQAAGKPAMLSEPRDGGADDLKQINGVGPGLEKNLNGMGIYHFDQIAAWSPSELAWIDDNLLRFKGRASRDNWIDQAKKLSSG